MMRAGTGRVEHGGVHIDKAIDPASGERLFVRQGWARDKWTRAIKVARQHPSQVEVSSAALGVVVLAD